MPPWEEGLTAVLPAEAKEIFIDLGFKAPNELKYLTIVDANNEEEIALLRKSIFNIDNSEGAVVYQIFQDQRTGEEKVGHAYKYKNYKYTFWRAVREKMKNRSPSDNMVKRLQNFHIEIPDQDLLIDQAIKFYAYCWATESNESWDNLFGRWITKMNAFKKVADDILQQHVTDFKAWYAKRSQLQILSVGFPGAGKSTLLRCLAKIVPDSMRLNQDECKKSNKIYYEKVARYSQDFMINTLLLDKSYHRERIRKNTLYAMRCQRIVYLVFYRPKEEAGTTQKVADDGLASTIQWLKERIYKRGTAHLNLFPSPKLESVLHQFQEEYEPLSEAEIAAAEKVIIVDMTLPKKEQVSKVLQAIDWEEGSPYGDSIIEKAVTEVEQEEEALRQAMGKSLKTLYWSAVVQDSTSIFHHPTIKKVLAQKKQHIARKELHATLVYLNGEATSIDERDYLALEGKNIPLTITAIAWDDKAVALTLKPDFLCHKETPHMTLALTEETPPVYANTMLDQPLGYALVDNLSVNAQIVRMIK